jgi:hypothetical protein
MTAEPYSLEANILRHSGLWFGPLAGAIAFSLAGFIDWVISSRACFIGHGSLGPFSPQGVRWLLVAITIVLLILALAGLRVSYRYWRYAAQGSAAAELVDAEGQEPAEFISIVGTLANTGMALGVIWIGLIFIFTEVCIREH